MMPAYNARKREQDEARREQQADERIRELEKKNKALRRIAYDLAGALRSIAHAPGSDDTSPEKRASDALVRLRNGECDLRDGRVRELEEALEAVLEDSHSLGHVSPETLNGIEDALDGGGDDQS